MTGARVRDGGAGIWSTTVFYDQNGRGIQDEGFRMKKDIFTGKLVRLSVEDPQVMAEALSRWARDTEYLRLVASDLAQPFSIKATREWWEKELEKTPQDIIFYMILTLEGDRMIGMIGLDDIQLSQGDAFVGISLGERLDWGKGYGTDAMRVLLGYAFNELNLHRVSLDVFEYNPRAIRSYEKAGFTVEGRCRQYLHREGRRWDLIFMGILREEWEQIEKS